MADHTKELRYRDMTPLQKLLFDLYKTHHAQRRELQDEVDQALYHLRKAREERDGQQRALEEVHRLLAEHGAATAWLESVFPLALDPEREEDGLHPAVEFAASA